MKKSFRYLLILCYLLCIHILSLVILSLFRGVEYLSLSNKMMIQADDNVGEAFLRGVWFDNVVGCYILAVPLILVLFAATFGYYKRWVAKTVLIFTSVLYILAFAISASNIPYYAYFAKNINSSIFNWFGYAGTTTNMVVGEKSYWLYIVLFLFASIGYVLSMVKLFQWLDCKISKTEPDSMTLKPIIGRLCLTLFLGGLCIFGIRGRVGYNPIKISEAYYCNNPFLNQLGISPAFNLLTSIMDDLRPENKELHLMPYSEAISEARQSLGISNQIDSSCVLRRHIVPDSICQDKPNVVLILIESMSAAFLHSMGQKEQITPVLDSLYKTSWAFTNCYSAGIHTNHGITASLYSFPALMKRNLMKGTVTPHREGLPTILKQQGYHNMFFMTHEAQYDNMNAFLRTNGYDDVFAQEDYPISERANAFGVSDHFLFEYGLERISEAHQNNTPWMATLLTISNHPPYVIPDWFKPCSKVDEYQIVEYADWCIGDFLRKAKKQPWYDNTLFIIMADHGKIVGEVETELPESYNHIPLIIFGPNINPRQDSQLAMQVDLMPTILGLMGIEYDFDGFGIDLSRQHRDMVFYTADDQIVGRNKDARLIYVPATQQTFKEGSPQSVFEDLRRYAFAMVQTAEFMQQRKE